MNSFNDLGLAAPILSALTKLSYQLPTPIQTQSIPVILSGHDLLGIAQTGTGKTAAFALPILNKIAKTTKSGPLPHSPRALVLAPTRELAIQIRDSFAAYGRDLRVRIAVAIGGVPLGRQKQALAKGVDVLIATPGRLIDLLGSHSVRLDGVETLVLDEADRMLDMGFIVPIRRIVGQLPRKHQTLLFSATLPSAITKLAADFLVDPIAVAVTPAAKTADRVVQHVVYVSAGEKLTALVRLLNEPSADRALVFARTKRGADKIVRRLADGGITANAIHGNKSQPQRQRALDGFRDGRTRVLIATDIAARGIDIPAVSHVINFDVPNEPESYVHRIGRTARAGATGIAISLCTDDDREQFRAIERLIKINIPEMGGVQTPLTNHRPARAGRPPNRAWRRAKGSIAAPVR